MAIKGRGQQILIQQMYEVPKVWHDPVLTAAGMTDMLQLGNIFLWAQIENEASVGHVVVRSDGIDWEILTLWVQPTARRRNVARGLLRALIAAALTEKTAKIFLDVRPSNTPAVKLYEQLGFKQIAVRTGYYAAPREDALVYGLDLS